MEQLFTSLTRHDLILTGNKRLSRRLRHDYAQWQQQREQTVWHSLNILPFDSWLVTCWQLALAKGLAPSKILLQESQAQLIWEEIISTSQDSALLNISATAQEARAAWRLLQQWQLLLSDQRLRYSDEGNRFVGWAKRFETHYSDYIESASLLSMVTDLITQHHIDLPKRVILLGFIDITPNQQQLFDTLQQQGVTLIIRDRYHQMAQANAIYQTCLATTEDEISAMLNWAKSIFTNHPDANIGCIVPQLNQYRSTIERYCQKILGEIPVNISSGISFIQEPIIDTAITILQLVRNRIPFADISLLLRSPFIAGSESERQQRALLDMQWRKQNRNNFSCQELIAGHTTRGCPILKSHLTSYTKIQPSQQKSPSKWAEFFCEQLSALGWPGERSLNSREYQAVSQWRKLLVQFSQLALIKKQMSHQQALSQLIKMAAATLFQHQTEDSAIQILGLLEITGLPFTHSWIMGLDDNHWPQPAKPNTLLPYSLQRALNMPHASANRELHFAKTVMNSVIHHNSKQVVFSWPQQEKDQPLSPSPLLAQFASQTLSVSAHDDLLAAASLEQLDDWQAPIVKDGEKIGGGSALFKNQAQCPFRAFANHRLGTQPLEMITPGLNPRQRGTLLHKVLELFWRQITSHAELCALNDSALHHLIDQFVDEAMKIELKNKNLSTRFFQIEKRRLYYLMQRWLQVEKSRPPFTVIAREQRQKIEINHISLTIQIDRIDRLESGSHIIIDYKSGASCSVKNWFGDRPDEPQLPLYAATQSEKPIAIFFAQVYRSKLRMLGIADSSAQLPGTIPLAKLAESYPGAQDSWAKQCDHWQQTLRHLADQFSQGEAQVDPKNGDTTCRACFCQLTPLCRINEQSSSK